MGRTPLPDEQKRVTVSVRLSPWLVVELSGMPEGKAQAIEKALIRWYKLKPPKGSK